MARVSCQEDGHVVLEGGVLEGLVTGAGCKPSSSSIDRHGRFKMRKWGSASLREAAESQSLRAF